jgi:hypothetical protein
MKLSAPLKFLTTTALAALLTATAPAAPVTFWFSGVVDSTTDAGTNLPTGIAMGTVFTGRITYDATLGDYQSGFVNGSLSSSNIYFANFLSTTAVLYIGGHTVTNQLLDPERDAGSLHIRDNYDNEDNFIYYAGMSGLAVGGQSFTNSRWNIYLKDGTKTANTSAAFPTTPPSLAAFASKRAFNWVRQDDANQYLFSVDGQILALSTNEMYALTFRVTGNNTAQVAWPVVATGFTLQSSGNPVSGWQDVLAPVVNVGGEHTVNVTTTGAPKFYRLKK